MRVCIFQGVMRRLAAAAVVAPEIQLRMEVMEAPVLAALAVAVEASILLLTTAAAVV